MNPQWQFNHMAIPLGFSFVLVIGMIALGLRKRHSRVAMPYLAFLGAVFIWLGTTLLETLTLNEELGLFFSDLSFLGVTFMPVAWYAVMMFYIGKEHRFYRYLPFMLVPIVLTNMVIWTNPLHHLWRGDSYRDLTLAEFPVSFFDYGLWYYAVHIPVSLGIIALSMYALIYTLRKSARTYRVQLSMLIVALLLPVTVAMLDVIDIRPIEYFNAAPLVFPISALLTALAVLDFGFLDLTPIARDLVVENMEDLMIVLDNKNRILDINPKAKQSLGINTQQKSPIGTPISTFLPDNQELTGWITKKHHLQNELEITRNDKTRVYEVFLSPINRNNGTYAGRLLLMRDITDRKRAEEAVYEQIQQLAIVNERQRVARELHDSVNQTLFAAGTLADLLSRAITKKPEKVSEYASNIQQLLHGVTAEMRLVLLELYPDALTQTDLSTIVQHLCDAFTGVTGTTVNFITNGQIHLDKDPQIAFYRVAQEALHNINKHTEATNVCIQLLDSDNTVSMCIEDNGGGFDIQTASPESFGLKNMIERANAVNATLHIDSQPNIGTTIKMITIRKTS